MGEKIVELQGLRCIAIISVLLFHIWPDTFRNGFLGVDIFFVVSGYLMALILLSSNTLEESFFTTTLTFYYRRIYRILPLYLLNVFITILIAPVMSYTLFYFNFLDQVKSALTFSTNFEMLFQNLNYFSSLSFNAFKHYWSLCVEMQFYVIVPFLLYLSKRFKLLVSLFLLWPVIIGGCVFLIFYMLINYGIDGAQFTFTMLPARMYEFVGGFVAFHIQEAIDLYFHDDHKILSKIKIVLNSVVTANILTLALLILSLFPIKLVDVYTLPATVILTSTLIAASGRPKEKNDMKYSLLANKFCIFIGDASYSLYICHWIIVFLGKALYGDDAQHRQLILVICIVVGVIVHLCIEKPIVMARLEPKVFLTWIIISYLAILYVAFAVDFNRSISKNTEELFHNKSEQIGNKIVWKEILENVFPETSAELGVYSWLRNCDFNYADQHRGNGSLKVLVIGNSHARCIFFGVKLAMKGMYSYIKLIDIAGVTPFEGFQNAKNLNEIRKSVKDFKPDIIYLIFKYMDDFEEPMTSSIDLRVQTMQEMTSFLSNNSKVLFISNMHFGVPHFTSLNFADQMYHNGFTRGFRIKRSDIENLHAVSTRRWEQIKCKNCIFIDMLAAFCKNGWCSPLDESQKVPLMFDDNHVNKLGSHWLGFHLQKYFDKMFKILDASSKL